MLRGLIYALLSATAFGCMAILVKLGYQAGMTGSEMMQYRFTYAAVILFAALLVKDRRLLVISRKGLAACAFLGLVVYWLQTSCFVQALATIPASTTALVLYVHPVTVTLLSIWLLKMKPDRVVGLSLGLVMGGCCLVFYDAFLKAVDPAGLLYATGAMIFFSIYLILVQILLKGIRPLTATVYVISFAAISFTLTGNPGGWLELTPKTFAIGFALGVVPGVIAVSLLYLAIEKVGSAYACIFSTVEPVVTLAAAAAFLNENVVLLQIGGAALIILGIVIPNARVLTLSKKLETG
ncbi:EamA family transporter [Pseudodesulfovibrio cashew]|uniref:EamA family transporter n=1 Tax=Pseudodesulfovibrio cashew TaxID=2678688 RepID=A0A6I6JHF2_9BACT|nr:DMT family transporter [Pseudodesulfovibrio cashew]QGY40599.1 EamA family transporter [Pseudodesulfovibrio cashew]